MRKTFVFLAFITVALAWPAAAGDGFSRGRTPDAEGVLAGQRRLSPQRRGWTRPEPPVSAAIPRGWPGRDFLPQNNLTDPFDEARTACVGDWKHRSGRTFDVTLYCLWQESWVDAPAVPDRIRMKVTLNKSNDTWTATPFFYEEFDGPEYTPISSPASWGSMGGVRLEIVPIP